MTEASRRDRYLAPGTRVTLRSLEVGAPEHGVVIHCWGNDEINAWDCYVAFFGEEMPLREPASKPYVLRYAASSLKVAEPSPHALLLRDTLVDLRERLAEVRANSNSDDGYAMGLDHATSTLKNTAEAFGLRDDLGWMEPDVSKWLRSEN